MVTDAAPFSVKASLQGMRPVTLGAAAGGAPLPSPPAEEVGVVFDRAPSSANQPPQEGMRPWSHPPDGGDDRADTDDDPYYKDDDDNDNHENRSAATAASPSSSMLLGAGSDDQRPPGSHRSWRNDLDRVRRKAETDDQREARLERRRLANWKKLQEEPPDRILEKKERRNAIERDRRMKETPQERQERLAKRKEYEQRRKHQQQQQAATGGDGNAGAAGTEASLDSRGGGGVVGTSPTRSPRKRVRAALPIADHRDESLPAVTADAALQAGTLPFLPDADDHKGIDPWGGYDDPPDGPEESHDHRNEPESSHRKHETDEERAVRRAKRNEYDRRRYRARKEKMAAKAAAASGGTAGQPVPSPPPSPPPEAFIPLPTPVQPPPPLHLPLLLPPPLAPDLLGGYDEASVADSLEDEIIQIVSV